MTADFQMLTREPSHALRPFVQRILVVESAQARGDVHLPGTGFVAAFHFRGACRLNDGEIAPRLGITGLWDTARTHVHHADSGAIIVQLTATGGSALLRQPLEEFANATADLDDVLGSSTSLNQLHEEMAEAASHEHRLQMVEEFLLAHVRPTRPDPEVAAAVALIERSQAQVRVHEIARRVGLSQSALERRFRRFVGATPRKFASIVRLQNVIRLHESGADFTAIAHGAGYYDQAHFIHDFKRFTGHAPTAFFARAAS